MRTRRCGEKSNRRCVSDQHHFFDADARLDRAGKYGPKNQGGDGCCNYPPVGSSIHIADKSVFRYPENVRLPSRLIPHRHRSRAELQPAYELQVDVLR